MYLNIISFLFILNNIAYAKTDCGCQLNRNSESTCDSQSGDYKYSRETNQKLHDNNDLTSSKYTFDTTNMVFIKGNTFEMGTNQPIFPTDFEGPARNVTVASFYLDKYEISNDNFQNFIAKSKYKTEAEIFGDSFMFDMFLSNADKEKYDEFRAAQAPWWVKVKGVSWKHPEGPESSVDDKLNHPVVHVSWNDAKKYCEFYNKRLPTEAEWEMACRGGLKQKLYPWGNKLNPKNEYWANIWQGDFPTTNTVDDGYVATAPVNHYPPNKFGLHNMAGNVWEWTEDSWLSNTDMKVKKGGSYMCHESYCWRYRCAARSQNTQDSSAGNLGFRCAGDVKAEKN